jgi:hypothetical protein
MNHSEVISQGLVEKYILKELTAEQHDAFELHCFECADCAAELKTLYTLKESVRRTHQSEVKQAIHPSGWLAWIHHPIVARLSLATTVLLGVVVGYQNLHTLPELNAALETPTLVQTIRPGVRGALTESMEYTVPVRFREGFAAYRIDLRSPDGTVLRSFEASADIARASDGIRLRRNVNLQGKVEIVVSGLNASLKPEELNRYVLEIP